MNPFYDKDTQRFVDEDFVFKKAGGAAFNPHAAPAILSSLNIERVNPTEPPAVEPWQTVNEILPSWVGGEWVQAWEIINPPLEAVKDIHRQIIQQEYLRRETLPVECLGRHWKGGSSSGQGIRDAAEISAQFGQETVELWDIDHESQHYSLADARQIAAQIGVAYQQLFAQRATLLKVVAHAKSVDGVLGVSF